MTFVELTTALQPTKTNLSIKQVASLLEALICLQEKHVNDDTVELPEQIHTAVRELVAAQEDFVARIDSYMHPAGSGSGSGTGSGSSGRRTIKEVQTVKTIIETCPEFLGTKDAVNGDLPIHYFANNEVSCATYVPLLANIGQKSCTTTNNGSIRSTGTSTITITSNRKPIFPPESRGGLLLRNNDGFNALQTICLFASSTTMQSLFSAEPPLFVKSDVRKYYLLHEVVHGQSVDMAKFMIDLDPSCVNVSNDEVEVNIIDSDNDNGGNGNNGNDNGNNNTNIRYDIPLGYACDYERDGEFDEERELNRLSIVQLLLEKSLQYDISNPTIGGLFAKRIHTGEIIIDCIIERYGEERGWNCIEQALSPFVECIPILHKTIQDTPHHCDNVLNCFPDSVLYRDGGGSTGSGRGAGNTNGNSSGNHNYNRLPVHVALECGLSWSSPGLVSIINSNRQYLDGVDPKTNCPPFLLAAAGEKSCDLRTIYFLLRKYPEHIQTGNWHGNSSNEIDDGSLLSKRKSGCIASIFSMCFSSWS